MANIAGVLVVLCQTVAAVHASTAVPGAPEPVAAQQMAPCHNTYSDYVRQAPCQEQHPTAGLAKFDSHDATGIPALFTGSNLYAVEISHAPVSRRVPARAYPPPLFIVHCCLRN